MNIIWFEEIGKNDVKLVGGKGANLGEMLNSGFPVPPGFVVTKDAYFGFLEANGIMERIGELTRSLDVNDTMNLNAASFEIKDAIERGTMPDDTRVEIIRAYNELCGEELVPSMASEKYVAVRSSATAEDLPDASFAGQQASFLNVKGSEEVVRAVQRCWASLFEPRAIFYRTEKGYGHLDVGIAVVVQEMVQADVAGVVFTVEPMSGDESKIEIEAAYGLGELVVSGAITPDRYTVEKETLEIVFKSIAEQERMIVMGELGNESVPVIDELRTKQKLSDEKIAELAEIGRNIEAHYAYPQDIEWAVADEKLFIVQSRPVTALKKIAVAAKKEAAIEIEKGEIVLRGLGASPGVGAGKVKKVAGPTELWKVEKGDVLVAEMTTPDYVAAMKRAVGIVTDAGGMTCHAAIVSRELGIPCIVGTKEATKVLNDGELITVDASHGLVYRGKVDVKVEKAPEHAALGGAPVTGTKIYVNLAEAELADKVAAMGVDGVGLLRAEFMIAGIGVHPKKMIAEGREQEFIDKLAEGMRKFAVAFYPRPVVYRATDFRTNEYRNLEGGEQYEPQEANPMLGYRGCARYIAEPDVFKMELKAIRKVREEFGMKNLWLMLPFVRKIGELRAVKDIMREVQLHRTIDFKLWIMVEVPSAVFLIDEFCKEGIDGASIGSNDLTQLILGIDRDNATMAAAFDERNAAVMKAIEHVVRTCDKHGVTASICGQAPSVYPELAEKLVEFGITSISVNPDAIDRTRRIVASAEQKIILKRTAKLTEKEL